MTAQGTSAPPCPRCGIRPAWKVNAAVSMTAHYEDKHPTVHLFDLAREVVATCGPLSL